MSKQIKPNQFYLPSGALITERPILYQTEMIQANLTDLKTQTRREMNPQPIKLESLWTFKSTAWSADKGPIRPIYGHSLYNNCPYGKPGDLLYARETWHSVHDCKTDEFLKYGYKADWSDGITSHPKNKGIWNPSIHMPKAASRIWSMVEDVRIERLHDISKEDAIAEGIGRWVETRMKSQPTRYKVYTDEDPEALYTSDPIDSYRTLWISINGQKSWDANPWSWVVKYRILSKIGRPSMEVIERNYLEVIGKEVVSG